MHHIWLTHNSNPRELFTGDKYEDAWNIEFLYQKISLYNDWDHTLWAHNKSLIPITVSIAEKFCITIKNIGDIATERVHLADFFTKYDLDHYTLGAYIDITKYALAETYGGMILDINFYLAQKLENSHLKTYSTIISIRSGENSFICVEKGFSLISVILNSICDKFIPVCGVFHKSSCVTDTLFSVTWNRYNTQLYSYNGDTVFKEFIAGCFLDGMDEDLGPWNCKEKQNYPTFFYPHPDKLIDYCPTMYTIGGYDFKAHTWKIDCVDDFC